MRHSLHLSLCFLRDPAGGVATYTSFHAQIPRGVSRVLCIGGGDFSYSPLTVPLITLMLANPINRAAFIASAILHARTNNFNGIEIDFENMNSTALVYFDSLLTEMRYWIEVDATARGVVPLFLSTIAGAEMSGPKNFFFDIATLVTHLDWIAVLPYDFIDGRSPTVDLPSPLYAAAGMPCAATGVQRYLDAGVPAQKIVLTMPAFGHTWELPAGVNNARVGTVAVGSGPPQTYTSAKGFIAFFEAVLLIADGAELVSLQGTNYLQKGNLWASFDSIDAAVAKTSFALEKGLGGVAVWALQFDNANARFPLFTAIAATMNAQTNRPGASSPSLWSVPVVILSVVLVAVIVLAVLVDDQVRRSRLRLQQAQNDEARTHVAGKGNSKLSIVHLTSV